MEMTKRYSVTVELDENGEECLPFPEELLEELGWKAGDVLTWRADGNSWILTKKEEKCE